MMSTDLLYDNYYLIVEFAEKLFQKLEGFENRNGNRRKNERFEVKLLIWDIISRLIGVHKLFVFNFYPLIQKRLQPHQQGTSAIDQFILIFVFIYIYLFISLFIEATKFLQFVAQATHELIPPDVSILLYFF